MLEPLCYALVVEDMLARDFDEHELLVKIVAGGIVKLKPCFLVSLKQIIVVLQAHGAGLLI